MIPFTLDFGCPNDGRFYSCPHQDARLVVDLPPSPDTTQMTTEEFASWSWDVHTRGRRIARLIVRCPCGQEHIIMEKEVWTRQ